MVQPIDAGEFLRTVRPALEEGDADALAYLVSKYWTVAQICRFLTDTSDAVRGAAALSLGAVGDHSHVSDLMRCLRDDDPHLAELAEHAILSIWFRGGSSQAAVVFKNAMHHLERESYEMAIDCFQAATHIDPGFAEAFNQCAIAHFFVNDYQSAIRCHCRAVKLVPLHFLAIAGIGHCYAQSGDLTKAQYCYQRALRINPNMPKVAGALARINKRLGALNDASGAFNVEAMMV